MRNTFYSEREEEIIKTMVDNGATIAEIMKVVNRARQSLESFMQRKKLALHKHGREINEEAFKEFMKGR